MSKVAMRPMRPGDLDAAERLFRLAFGTWFGLADPMQFRGDASLFRTRLPAYPEGGVVAEQDGAIVALGFASRWGSLGVLGPIAVRPDLWRQGIAREIVGATIEIIEGWQCRLAGLFTFPQSAAHLRLYQHFGFWPRHLTPILAKPVEATPGEPAAISLDAARDRDGLIAQCRALTDATFPGLDLTREIEGVLGGFGDVLLLAAGSRLDGFAICHTGEGSDGGSNGVYVKFALARPGPGAGERLERLVQSCEAFAAARGVAQLSAGVPTGRHHAYRLMVGRGYRTLLMGVMMHRPWGEAYDGPETYALDDWR
jgi:GNAT superfamily N-acetyltransferase